MDEYTTAKIEYYGKPMKFLNQYRTIFIKILMVLNSIGLIGYFFTKPFPYIQFVIHLICFTLFFLSILSFPLLDKTAFIINLFAITYKGIWALVGTIISIISIFSLMGNINASVNEFSSSANNSLVSGGANVALSAVNGSLMIGLTIGVIINLAIIAFYVIVAISFIKHRALFFTDFKTLKNQVED